VAEEFDVTITFDQIHQEKRAADGENLDTQKCFIPAYNQPVFFLYSNRVRDYVKEKRDVNQNVFHIQQQQLEKEKSSCIFLSFLSK
jgi:hypothetical protein